MLIKGMPAIRRKHRRIAGFFNFKAVRTFLIFENLKLANRPKLFKVKVEAKYNKGTKVKKY